MIGTDVSVHLAPVSRLYNALLIYSSVTCVMQVRLGT